jgi:AcrR family transcriptional regulator
VSDIADNSAAAALSPLRDQAIARSLDGARERAEQRVQRFLDAATELILENAGLDFTVQDVVERSTQSLRSFYQFFDGKQHLLLAVYEEAIRAAAAELATTASQIDDPLERLHTTIVTIYEWSEGGVATETPSPHLTVRSMATFVFELLVTERESVVAATAPLYEQVLATLEEVGESGAIEIANYNYAAGFLLQTTMFNAFGTLPEGGAGARSKRAEALWAHCLNGIAGAG